AAHRDPVLEERLASAPGQAPVTSGTSALEAVIERGEPTLVRDVSDDWLAARARDAEHLGAAAGARPTSLMLVPLRARGRTLGVVSFVLVNGARRYALADLALAEDLAQRAALAANRRQQVVANLLSNAGKFTPAGGRVEGGVARAGDDLRLTVADTGDGLAPEVAPHIFDRFRQADSTITRQYGGLGLGLSIVR